MYDTRLVAISREIWIHGEIPLSLVMHRITSDNQDMRSENDGSQLLHPRGTIPVTYETRI